MARRTTVLLEDDIDGGHADHQVSFALDGIEYEIDLNDANAEALRRTLDPYVNAGRRTGGRRQQKAAAGVIRDRTTWLSEVRAWARANGHNVSDRGRIAKVVVDAYAAANP